jgi:uncharacterized protein
LVLIILWFFRRPENRHSRHSRHSRAAGMRAAHQAERMVQCGRCGIYLPEDESIADGAVHYCCAEHRRAAQNKAD